MNGLPRNISVNESLTSECTTLSKADSIGSRTRIASAVANFSVQYNINSIAIAIPIMAGSYKENLPWLEGVLSAGIFAGCIIGMLIMGYAGDVLGRLRAMSLTLSLATAGILLSTLAPWGAADQVYTIIAVFRVITGIGIGGVYPLSATAAAESSNNRDLHRSSIGNFLDHSRAPSDESQKKLALLRAQNSARAFFWQTPGVMGPYAVAMVLVKLTQSASIRFRCVIGLGVLPAALSIFLSSDTKESLDFRTESPGELLTVTEADDDYDMDAGQTAPSRTTSPLKEVLKKRETWVNLVATGGTWFIYDVVYYGVGLLGPRIIDEIFTAHDDDEASIFDTCWRQLIACGCGLPAVLLSIWLLPFVGLKGLMATGFLLQAALALIMAATLNLMGSNEKLLYGLYCSLIFSLNYGPNVATFVLPAEVFPAEVRTTLNGWASACGKLGALVGAFGLDVLLDMSNLTLILCLCAVLCLAGWCLTVVCLPASSSENFTCDRSKYHPPKRTAQLPPLHTVEESVSDRDEPQDEGDSGALITHSRDTTWL